jgi:hypothetical protein
MRNAHEKRYGPGATEVAAAEQPKWTSWLRGLLEGERIAN